MLTKGTKVDDVEALRFALFLALSEFVGPDHIQDCDEDALAIRFVYEGLSITDAIDLATVYTYGPGFRNTEFQAWRVPPLGMGWQDWLDNPPVRDGLTADERRAIETMRAELDS